MRKTVAILGIPIDDLDTEQVLARLEEFIRSRRFHQVATANTDFLIRALADPELKTILRNADLVVPDGMPLVLASRWLRVGLPERVTGADLVPLLAQLAAEKGYRLFMLGARPEVAALAKARLEEANPGLQIVGCVSPPVASIVQMDNEALLAQIAAAQPDILLVAFGNPKQEKWIAMHRHRLQVPVCIGVGGTFDFIAGTVARAPQWMQRRGMEWLYRLMQEPRRLWRRYVTDMVQFARFILLQLWVMRRGRERAAARMTEIRTGDCTVVSVVGTLGIGQLTEFQYLCDRALNAPSHLLLDLQGAEDIDSAVLGTLLNLPKRAAYVGREVRIVGLNARTRRTLGVAYAQDLFRVFPTFADALRGGEMEGLEAHLQMDDTAAIVSLRGRASADAFAETEARLQTLPATVRYVDVDLRCVSYIDCGVIAFLYRFADNLKQRGGQLRLLPGEPVQQALARERLNGLFEIADAPRPISPAPASLSA